MFKTIISYWNFIKNIGVAPNTRPYELKIKQFYNLITFLGAFTGVTHVILSAPYDIYATVLHAIWTCFCFIGLVVHKYVNFKIARFITFTSVFLFAGLASARLGFELNTHFASFGVVVACFIMHDLKKEWGWLIFYMILEVVTIIITESNIMKSEELAAMASGSPVFTRSFILIGTMVFVMFQFIFFIALSVKNERNIIERLRMSNKELMELNSEKEVLLKKEIEYTISSELTSIQNDSIVPISLILNELMSNSLKHGFVDQQRCEIHVAIVALKGNKYQLSYSDNGTWKTAEPTSTSFGIELIQSLTEQLDGKIVQKPTEQESRYIIDFCVKKF